MQTDGKGPVEVQQRLRNILAGVGDADLPLGLRLLDQLVVRLLQEILKILQILQVSPCVVYPPFSYSIQTPESGRPVSLFTR